MKKILFLLVFAVLLSSALVLAVPPWKQQQTAPSQPTQTTIIIQNITQVPTGSEGTNWEKIGAIVGIIAVIGAIIGWLLTRKKSSRASSYIKSISETFSRYKNDASKCEAELYSLKEKIEGEFARGKISEESFSMLDSRIDRYMSDVRKGIITTFELPSNIKKELNHMLEDGIISSEEYKKFSKMDLKHLPKAEKEKLNKLMKRWKDKDKK